MMFIKKGASINGIKPEIVHALNVASDVWKQLFSVNPYVTSGTEGKHSRGSLHYVGYAVDLRSNNLTGDSQVMAIRALKECLGIEYDIVLEPDHIHLEFQPKRGLNLD